MTIGKESLEGILKRLRHEVMYNKYSLIFKSFGQKLIGICALYADETLHVGIAAYYRLSKLTEQKFKCERRE